MAQRQLFLGDGNMTGDDDGFPTGDNGGYSPGDDGGYSPGDNGGFPTGDNGGFPTGDNGGYSPGDDGGYSPGDDSGYSPGDDSGYSPGDDKDMDDVSSDEWATTSDDEVYGDVGEPNADMANGIVTPNGLRGAPSPLPLPGQTRPRQHNVQPCNLGAVFAALATGDDKNPGENPDDPHHQA